MIPEIKEVNFPSYATLHQATVSLVDMGERTITTQINIHGSIVPEYGVWNEEHTEFSPMELIFRGERFVLPIREPQAAKDNTSLASRTDLTFYSWPVYQLKRFFYFEPTTVASGTAMADKYIAPVRLPLASFVDHFNEVLSYYFNGSIIIALNPNVHSFSSDIQQFDISYSKLWDVLTRLYEIYAERWSIVYDEENDRYTIVVGATNAEVRPIEHIFQYGHKGGLLKFERQVQDPAIYNHLLGRGGEKNLPYRYFKRTDSYNPEWNDDPDAIYELKDIYFDRLRDMTFRWYVRGWMQNAHRDLTWNNQGYQYPYYYEWECGENSDYIYAFNRGKTDETFNPVEFVKNAASAEKYGEIWGALEDNDDIYPTIQGAMVSPAGDLDEVVGVPYANDWGEDDPQTAAQEATIEKSLMKFGRYVNNSDPDDAGRGTVDHPYVLYSQNFTIPTGYVANIFYSLDWTGSDDASRKYVSIDTTNSSVGISSYNTLKNIPAGSYRLTARVVLTDARGQGWHREGSISIDNVRVYLTKPNENAWKPTFDIWVKNIWSSVRGTVEDPETHTSRDETDEEYAERVWRPILGDHLGREAAVVFSTGAMATTDYEFIIAGIPAYDNTRDIQVNGRTVPSEWRISVYKSDAEFDSTGFFIPNSKSAKPSAGDHFFFTGIDIPFEYVTLAEERVTQYKQNALAGYSEIEPSWAITLDKIRVNTLEAQEEASIASRIKPGLQLHIKDPRFTDTNGQWVYVQSVNYRWDAASASDTKMLPEMEVVLSNTVAPSVSTFARLQGEVKKISSTYTGRDDVEKVIQDVASTLFLKKTGEDDSSDSPTTFAARVTSDDFKQGSISGTGWGFYRDNGAKIDTPSSTPSRVARNVPPTSTGNSTLEVDNLIVRKSMEVNELTVNQIQYIGGKAIYSAASMVVSNITGDGSANFRTLYFDQKQGTVKNLFAEHDIIMGQVFNPANAEVAYYKGIVTQVDVDNISVDFTLSPSNDRPAIGDVIVQYGNTTDPARQYVIIRDVIGGGYERMLSGLTTEVVEEEDPETGEITRVTRFTDGVEYYFAGREKNDTDKWFIGHKAGEYAEWHNSTLNIKGRISVRKSDGSYQAMDAYMINVQNQINNKSRCWSGTVDPLPIEVQGQIDPSTANYPANLWTTVAERAEHLADIFINRTTGQGWQYNRQANDGEFYWVRLTDAELRDALSRLGAQVYSLNYLKAALGEDTIIEGGLILTSLIQLGQTVNDVFTVRAGINGTIDEHLQDPWRSIAAWYGGPMTDHEEYPLENNYAQTLFRMNGTGYVAGGSITWDANGNVTLGSKTNINPNADVGNTGKTFNDFVSGLRDISTLQTDVDDLETDFGGLAYLTSAMKDGSVATVGGLILASAISLGNYDQQQAYHVTAGMNGSTNDSNIAAWYGGEMRTKSEYDSLSEEEKIGKTYAKIVLMHDGSGYVADGGITWTTGGAVTIAGSTVIGGTSDNVTLAGLANVRSAVDALQNQWKVGGSGTGNWYLYLGEKDGSNFLYASAPKFKATTSFDLNDQSVITGFSMASGVSLNHVTRIRATSASTSVTGDSSLIAWDGSRNAWHFHGAIYADSWISAGGVGSSGGGGGLVETVYRYSALTDGTTFSDGTTDVFNAYTTKRLADRISSLESAGYNTVSWAQESLTGINTRKIATITINNIPTDVYAPAGEVTSVAGLTGAITSSALSSALGLGAAASYSVGSVTSGNTGLVTGGAVWSAIDALPEPMIFKGSLGTNGTIELLPAPVAANEGWTYKVITAGTYASQEAKVGDLFISNGSAWIWIPSGDEPSGTVTSVGISLPTGLQLRSTDTNPITSSGTFHIEFASGYSLLQDTQATAWSAKYDKPSTGIPKTDLESSVQTSLGLADTALQSHQDISGKADKTSITAGTAGTSSATSGATIAIPYLTMTAQGVVSAYGTHSHSISKSDIGLGNVDNLAASGYFTALVNGSGDTANKITLTIGGTTKSLTVGYASNAGNASTLESHAASYFATATSVSTLQGYFTNGVANDADKLDSHDSTYFATADGLTGVSNRVTTLEGRTNWDTYFGIDANGNVYVKDNGNNPRGFYTNGFVSAGGIGSSGGGGGGLIQTIYKSTDFGGTFSQSATDDTFNAYAINSLYTSKQDKINDLSTIRSNAGNGNTAYGWGNHASAGYAVAANLATVATSGSYSDLSNKPTSLPANGGNADTVDNVHNGNLTCQYINCYTATHADSFDAVDDGFYQYINANNPTSAVGNNGALMQVSGRFWDRFQLIFPGNNEGLIYYRNSTYTSGDTYSWGAWKTIAFTDSNVASATYATSAGSVAWANVSGHPTALSSFTDDLGSSPTHTHSQYLTSHQSVVNGGNTASWGSSVTVGTVGGTALTFTMPSDPTYTLPTAAASTKGGIYTDYTSSGDNFGVRVDNYGDAYVYVPLSDKIDKVTSASVNGVPVFTSGGGLQDSGWSLTGSSSDITSGTYYAIPDCDAINTYVTGVLADYAEDDDVVHLAGTETITGSKTFSSALTAHNVVPSTTNSYNLGATDNLWANVYATNCSASTVFVGGQSSYADELVVYGTNGQLIHRGINYYNVATLSGTQTFTGQKSFSATIYSQSIIPSTNASYDLGGGTAAWQSLYLNGGCIYFNNANVMYEYSSGNTHQFFLGNGVVSTHDFYFMGKTLHFRAHNGTSTVEPLVITSSDAHFTVGLYSDSYVSAGGVSSSSDIRLKDNIAPVSLTLSQIAEAPAVEFTWRKDGSKGAGSIAQYWQDILPYNIHTNAEGMMSLEYGNIALLSTITVAKEVERLKARIAELERQLNA